MERTKDESDWKAVFVKPSEEKQNIIPSKSETEITALTKEMVSTLRDEDSKDFTGKWRKDVTPIWFTGFYPKLSTKTTREESINQRALGLPTI